MPRLKKETAAAAPKRTVARKTAAKKAPAKKTAPAKKAVATKAPAVRKSDVAVDKFGFRKDTDLSRAAALLVRGGTSRAALTHELRDTMKGKESSAPSVITRAGHELRSQGFEVKESYKLVKPRA